MSQVDQGIRQHFERITHFTSQLKTQQQSPEFILLGEDPPYRTKPLFEIRALNSRLRPRFTVFRLRVFSLVLGIIPRLKMALRLARTAALHDRLRDLNRRTGNFFAPGSLSAARFPRCYYPAPPGRGWHSISAPPTD